MAKIYLVRHGESVANTQGVYQGITYDTPLSQLGNKQAMALAEFLGNIKLGKIYASPLTRTRQTAQAVANLQKLDVELSLEVLETNHGEWEGKRKGEIVKLWPELYKRWQKFPSRVQFPEGEHFLDTQKRVLDWWNNLESQSLTDTLVVTHDNILRIIIAKVLNMKLNRIWKFHLQPAAYTVVEVDDGVAKLVELNSMDHLGGMQANLAIHAL